VVGPPPVATVLIGGQPAANVTSMHVCSMPPPAGPHPPTPFVPTHPNVLIGGAPALVVGDMSGCGAAILAGCPTVMIGG
jgi:uncharacterized Zn-binding protein involved in type VI secretion